MRQGCCYTILRGFQRAAARPRGEPAAARASHMLPQDSAEHGHLRLRTFVIVDFSAQEIVQIRSNETQASAQDILHNLFSILAPRCFQTTEGSIAEPSWPCAAHTPEPSASRPSVALMPQGRELTEPQDHKTRPTSPPARGQVCAACALAQAGERSRRPLPQN